MRTQDDGQTTTEDEAYETAAGADAAAAAATSMQRCCARRQPDAPDVAAVYKVLVLGSPGVGKTTLVEQLMTSEYLANRDVGGGFPGTFTSVDSRDGTGPQSVRHCCSGRCEYLRPA